MASTPTHVLLSSHSCSTGVSLHCHLLSTTAAPLTQTPCGEAMSLPWTHSNKCRPGAVGLVLFVRFKESRTNLQCGFFFLSAIFDTKLFLVWDLEVRKIRLYSEKDCKIPIICQIKTNGHPQEQNKILPFFWSVLLYTTTSIISIKLSKAVNNTPKPRNTCQKNPADKFMFIGLMPEA